MGSKFWEWYENFVFQAVDQVPSHFFHIKTCFAKDIAKGPQSYPSDCLWTGKKLTMDSFTQLLYNA